ncbi:MAG: adenosine deaminase [Thermoleophilia bacterium]|nr:adenosine deaminase [Thermoleophilia bacterium]
MTSPNDDETPRSFEELIRRLPKVELHLHLEGTLEPEMAFALAERNGVRLRFPTVETLRSAYAFRDLQSFLDLYYESIAVLRTERDFYQLTRAYLERAAGEHIRHAELFFDPQSHTRRGVPFGTVIEGIHQALVEGESDLGITTRLIMCFLRDLSYKEAAAALREALPYREWLIGVGLDSAELGHPPSAFTAVFAAARAQGLRVVAHAGEEGPPEYIWEALDLLGAERIDHGVRCLEDPALVSRLAAEHVPLTVCPLSNLHLRVVASLEDHPLRSLLEAGLCATINSDDPAYFGGYLTDNFLAIARALRLTRAEVVTLVRNSYQAAFIDEPRRRQLEDELITALRSMP